MTSAEREVGGIPRSRAVPHAARSSRPRPPSSLPSKIILQSFRNRKSQIRNPLPLSALPAPAPVQPVLRRRGRLRGGVPSRCEKGSDHAETLAHIAARLAAQKPTDKE